MGAPKITADGNCSCEIKRRLLLGRKVVTNLDSCGGHSAERERQWNFPPQSRGVPRRGEPAAGQPNPSARERQSDATGVPSEQFCFIATNSWFIRQARGFGEGPPIVAPIMLKVKL